MGEIVSRHYTLSTGEVRLYTQLRSNKYVKTNKEKANPRKKKRL
jgi:hypothetical protein